LTKAAFPEAKTSSSKLAPVSSGEAEAVATSAAQRSFIDVAMRQDDVFAADLMRIKLLVQSEVCLIG